MQLDHAVWEFRAGDEFSGTVRRLGDVNGMPSPINVGIMKIIKLSISPLSRNDAIMPAPPIIQMSFPSSFANGLRTL